MLVLKWLNGTLCAFNSKMSGVEMFWESTNTPGNAASERSSFKASRFGWKERRGLQAFCPPVCAIWPPLVVPRTPPGSGLASSKRSINQPENIYHLYFRLLDVYWHCNISEKDNKNIKRRETCWIRSSLRRTWHKQNVRCHFLYSGLKVTLLKEGKSEYVARQKDLLKSWNVCFCIYFPAGYVSGHK